MEQSKHAPSITFRSTKTNAAGESVCEEREVNGCTPEKLVELLSIPAFDVAEEEDLQANQFDELVHSFTDKISKLEFTLSEVGSSEGSTSFRFSTKSVQSDQQSTQPNAVQGSSTGHINVIVSDEPPENIQSRADKLDSKIEVRNHGLLVVNKNNLYAIVNVNLSLNLHHD